MPTLYIPEYIDIATSVPCGALLITSDWKLRLKQLIAKPQNTQSSTEVHTETAAACNSRRHTQMPPTAYIRNTEGRLS